MSDIRKSSDPNSAIIADGVLNVQGGLLVIPDLLL